MPVCEKGAGPTLGTCGTAWSLALAWALLVRFSSALFPLQVPVEASGAATVGALAIVTAGALPAMRRAVRVSDEEEGAGFRRRRARAAGIALAMIAATLLPFASLPVLSAAAASSEPSAPLLAVYAITGAAVGTALLGLAAPAVVLLCTVGFHDTALCALRCLAPAVGVFILIGCLLPRDAGWTCAALPLAALALLLRSNASDRMPRSTAASLPGSSEKQGSSMCLHRATLALAGFLTTLMPAMYPKTSNLAPYYLPDGALGMLSWRCAAAACLLLGLIALLAFMLDRRQRSLAAGIAAAVAVFAAVYFSLPSMSTSPVPFILITPASLVLLACATGLSAQRDRTALPLDVLAAALGGLVAGVFAYVALGPLFGTLPHQDEVFSLVPAVALAATVALMLVDGDGYAALLFPTSTAEGARLVTPLDERCAHVSARLGLTARESQVLALIAEGRNEPYMEKALSVSRATVKTHVSHIYRKAGVSSRQELLDVIQSGAGRG